MTAVIFDGTKFAAEREQQLTEKVAKLGKHLTLGSVMFYEDEAGRIYTRLKREAAQRVGFNFALESVSLNESMVILQEKIRSFCQRSDVDGVLIQKPMKRVWEKTFGNTNRYNNWWENIVAQLTADKDVDCLMKTNLQKVYEGTWQILPATVQAVLSILNQVPQYIPDYSLDELGNLNVKELRVVVLGRSDLVGQPVASVLAQRGARVSLFGKDLDLDTLKQADLVISATGTRKLLTGEMIKPKAVVTDVGAPGPDADLASIAQKGAFLTPVPEGVGPVTVISLMENLVGLVSRVE